MTFAEYKTFMASLLVYQETDTKYLLMLPRMIEDAENRINRDFTFLSMTTRDSKPMTPNNRYITSPTCIEIVQSISVITPAGVQPDAGTRTMLQRVPPDFIGYVWPQVSVGGVPQHYAMLNQTTAILGPAPDAAYRAEYIGIGRPDTLSATTPVTFISREMPDLFIAASAVFGFGYQRDFGQAADDPKAAMSWEAIYQSRKTSASITEAMKKAQSQGWQPYQPTPEVAPSQPRS